jgi:hypothetical protein
LNFGFGEPAERQGRAITGDRARANEFPALFSALSEFAGRAIEEGQDITRGIGEQNEGVSRSEDIFRDNDSEGLPEALDASFDFLERVSPEEPEEGVAEGRRGGAEDEDEE